MNMNNTEQQIKQVELTIEAARANIDRAKTLDKLTENLEFNTLIMTGYFTEEAARLVLLKADPNMMGEREQAHVNRLIDGIGALRQYFSTIERIGEMSTRAMAEHEMTREELLHEDMAEGAHA